MAKNRSIKTRRHRSNGNGKKVSLAMVLGLVPAVTFAMSAPNITSGLQYIVWSYTGYSMWEKRWSTAALYHGLYPLLGGMFVHFLANAFGVNKMISKVPYVQI